MGSLTSWILFGEGLVTGLTLTVMLGPVTMIILRNGLQADRKAAVYTAVGTWVSDFIFIGITYWLTSYVETWANHPNTRFALYLTGGIGLILMGLLMTRVKTETYVADRQKSVRYAQAFISGFLINSISPFTLFFWIGVAVFVRLQPGEAWTYYTGLMITLGLGDFTKAWLAPNLARWLKATYVYWIQVVAGLLIACTGGYILYLGIAG